MSWLSRTVLPKIRALGDKKETPDNLWHKCSNCGQMIFMKDLEANLHVCPHCDHHMRIGPAERFAYLFDDGQWSEIDMPDVLADPLKFKDGKKYPDRLKDAQAKVGQKDAVRAALGKIGGNSAVIAVQNFRFMGGSMGLAAGESFLAAVRKAVAERAALIMFSAAGGARMQEGILSLMQMPRTVIGVEMLREEGLPFIMVLTDPTTGGVTASFAMLGDIAIAEPGALIGFAGPRVIQQTIRETLPEGFQRAEYLYDHGMVDMVIHRRELRDTLDRIISLLAPSSGQAPKKAAPLSRGGRREIPHGLAGRR